MTLRPFEMRDLDAVLALRNEDLPPHRRVTASEWHAWEAQSPPGKVTLRLVVGDPPIAHLRTVDMNTTLMRHPGDGFVDIAVAPQYRRQGIGALLYDHALAFARERGLRRLIAEYTERTPDEPAIRFVARRGFQEMDRELQSRLDLTTFDPNHYAAALARAAAQNVRLLPYADLPDTDTNRRRLYDLDVTIDRDMPTHDDAPFEHPPFDAWTGLFSNPEFDPRALILAELDGDWIGLTRLNFRQETNIGSTQTTGVLALHRGRGLAYALKVRSLIAAQSRACPLVTTENHEDNAPMLAINRKLGFLPDPPQVRCQKPLPPDEPRPEPAP